MHIQTQADTAQAGLLTESIWQGAEVVVFDGTATPSPLQDGGATIIKIKREDTNTGSVISRIHISSKLGVPAGTRVTLHPQKPQSNLWPLITATPSSTTTGPGSVHEIVQMCGSQGTDRNATVAGRVIIVDEPVW